ncbi:type II toxin-antitoxin system HipA family toxin [Desulfobacter sp.]|uniref:type II toxin-antitoxin system HipA family toxin n=1 Tax=Desulfobacter sp. TaxID=2294 RepID=UPI003D112D1C
MGKAGRLSVLMNGSPVGWLARSSKGIVSFGYDRNWLSDRNRRPLSLSLPLTAQVYSGDRVENFFDNLLPDNMALRNRLQARTGASSTRAFDLLSYIGRDCVGAVQLVPEGERPSIKMVTADRVDDSQIEAILKSYSAMPLGVDIDADFRLSVAGAQEKTAFLRMQGGWYRPSGATPTSHIFKLPMGWLGQTGLDLSGSVENEWLCQKLLDAFGMAAADTQMANFGSQKVLVVKRFDRRWSADGSWLIRLPQEDFCQATGTPSALKYEADGGPGMAAIMGLLLGSDRAHVDRTVFMTAQVLFWMLGAIDGHAKNFSIFLRPGSRFHLTPLYDVISIYPLAKAGQVSMHKVKTAMAVSGKNRHYRWNSITRRHWLDTAKKCRYPEDEMKQIIEKCCDMVQECIDQAGAALPPGFPGQISSAIFSGIHQARERLIK